MAGRRTRIGNLIVLAVVVLLLCVIVTMELPELLTLTDDTTNDFTIRKTITVDSLVLSLSGSHQQTAGVDLNIPAPEFFSLIFSPVEKAASPPSRLFILHLELRT